MLWRILSRPWRFLSRRDRTTPHARSKKISSQRLMLEALEDRTLPSAVQVTLEAPATVVRGMDLRYAITVFNNSGSDVAHVRLTDALPSGATLQSQRQTDGPAFALDYSGNGVSDTLDTLP